MQTRTAHSNRHKAFIRGAAKALGGAALALAMASTAQAHPGHGDSGLWTGFNHPFTGLDHLLAMVAVGMWSVVALPKAWRLTGPALFLASLLLGAALAVAGVGMPGVEAGIALSVVALAALMLGARIMAPSIGLALVACAGVFHGYAHGLEMAGGHSFMAYAAGFMLASALLHVAGLASGAWLQKLPAWVWRSATALIGASGVLMLAGRM